MQKAVTADFKTFDASDCKIAIVVAHFNRDITERLEKSALARAEDYKIAKENIDVVYVAGAIEIPLVLQQLAKTHKYQALLAVGCVIKGETPHFNYVCKFVSEGILQVQLDNSMPIGFGVLTCNDEAQALSRAKLGGEHLDAAMHQAQAIKNIGS
jgi:6,7-dimethyl-8-ribityllumazine synthase